MPSDYPNWISFYGNGAPAFGTPSSMNSSPTPPTQGALSPSAQPPAQQFASAPGIPGTTVPPKPQNSLTPDPFASGTQGGYYNAQASPYPFDSTHPLFATGQQSIGQWYNPQRQGYWGLWASRAPFFQQDFNDPNRTVYGLNANLLDVNGNTRNISPTPLDADLATGLPEQVRSTIGQDAFVAAGGQRSGGNAVLNRIAAQTGDKKQVQAASKALNQHNPAHTKR